MYKKTVKDRYLVLLILFTFCLSFPSLGGQLWYGGEVEYGHHNVHIHGHRIGEEVPNDEHFAVYYDFLTIKPSSTIKACPVINLFLHTRFYPEYHHNFSEISSVHHQSINRFHSTSLYQLNSSYLI